MRYRDLVTFEPVESVKQLREADRPDQALEDVRTYIISEKLRGQLVDVVLPSLRFDNPEYDHKGLLLIATYGTGKTHLMSVVSAVAENAELTKKLTDEATATAAGAIAGKFKVIRVEIGAVQMGLRDILATELTEGLGKLGVSYHFPPLDKVTNNKRPLQEMMAAFEEAYPDHGLLLVVDELLDFLRTRKDSEIILDLGFLREMGEFCRDGRFRIIAGVQETIFDNPRFAAAQSEVRRVRERFQSFRIAREDVAYVVQRRLLSKSPEQKNLIREHLTQFGSAFESLGRNLDTFVDMFPVHPAYLKAFEALTIVEKRRILSSLTEQLRQRLDLEVPTDAPGVICFDAYRAELDADPANRVVPEVRDVLERTRVLRDHIERNLPVPTDVAPALRIVDALAIHRLTTDDLDAQIGLTVDDLRDDLCLLPYGTPELDASFIASSIEALIQEISKAVSGQFISINEGNGQIYLDLKKDVDYEAQVNERAATLDEDELDGAYYTALEQLLEVSASPYVAGYRIWSYELPWAAKRVNRLGYLFMGAPNERSTAQPPRDFYLYFLQPYAPPKFDDPMNPDEVFLRLEDPDKEFEKSLRRYAASLAKVRETTSQHRQHFEARAAKHFEEMKSWLRANMSTKIKVTYQGEHRSIAQWLAGVQGGRRSLKEQIDTIASAALATYFATRYPSYPVFADQITAANSYTAAQAALAQLAGRDTALGRSILTTLQLRDQDEQITQSGQFASALASTLGAANGGAVNEAHLLSERDPGVKTWAPWHLEPLWLVVTGAALTYLGRAELGFAGGQKVTASNLDDLSRMSQVDLERLSYITSPAGADAALLTRIATLLGLPPALGQGELSNEAVAQFMSKADTEYGSASELKAFVQTAPRLWGEELFDDPVGRFGRINSYLDVLADVRARTSIGKLKRIKLDLTAIDAAETGRKELVRVDKLKRVSEQLTPIVRYLEDAGNVLGANDPFAETSEAVRGKLREVLRAPSLDKSAAALARQEAEDLRAQYRSYAVERHTADRLPASGDAEKQALVTSDTWSDLSKLTSIELLPSGQFAAIQAGLVGLVACKQFAPADYDSTYTCPHCGYRPTASSGATAQQRLKVAANKVGDLWTNWVTTLRDSVSASEILDQLSVLGPNEQGLIQELLEDRITPGAVTEELVSTVAQLLNKFEIVHIAAADLVDAIFPSGQATTIEGASAAFESWLGNVSKPKGSTANVRIVLDQEENQ
jgi:hypothetical protein